SSTKTTTHPVVGPPVHGFPPPLAAVRNSERKGRRVACPGVQTFPLSPVPAQNPTTKDRLVAGPWKRIPPPSLAPALHVGDKGQKHWVSSWCYTAASLIQVVAVPLRCSICCTLKSILASTVNRILSRSTCLVRVVVVLLRHTWSVVKSILASIVAQTLSSLTSSIRIQCSIRARAQEERIKSEGSFYSKSITLLCDDLEQLNVPTAGRCNYWSSAILVSQ
ncbi:hypothetical protein L210DRAFT_3532890, partial [Boletus edulis BED1]